MAKNDNSLRRIAVTAQLSRVTESAKRSSTVRVRQLRRLIELSAEYTRSNASALLSLASFLPEQDSLFLGGERPCFAIFGVEKGMCGGLARGLSDFAADILEKHNAQRTVLFGRKSETVSDFECEKRPFPHPDRTTSAALAAEFLSLLADGSADSVFVIYSSAPLGEPTLKRLLPIEKIPLCDIITDEDRGELVRSHIPRYLTGELFLAAALSAWAEQHARMMTTSAASDNAREMNEALTLAHNRERQRRITEGQ